MLSSQRVGSAPGLVLDAPAGCVHLYVLFFKYTRFCLFLQIYFQMGSVSNSVEIHVAR